jgi:phosphatidylglycerol:prolipoprotein diacylglycerol transferase
MPLLLSPFLAPIIALIVVTPEPIAFHLGPIPVFWYGVCYAVGLAAAYFVITREARRRGLNARLVDNGIIIVGIAALIGGRLYHVIDQWHLYQDNLLKIVTPPYAGLGVYGGILTGTLTAAYLTRRWHQSFWKWVDVIAPGLFVMQAFGRWGNFFNQELYGSPTTLPWGIAIDCAHRIDDHSNPQYACATYPLTTGFQPLFLYESLSGLLGAVTLLWIARRWGPRMRPGDLFLIFIIWYAAVRLVLETFRTGNWTVGGVPTAIIVSVLAIVGATVLLAIRHRPGAAEGHRWGDPTAAERDEEWLDDEDDLVDDDDAATRIETDQPGVARAAPADPGIDPAVDSAAEPDVGRGAASDDGA